MTARRGIRPLRRQAGFLSQRALGILMVLCVLMLVPYWMAKRVSSKTVVEVGTTGSKKPVVAAGNTQADRREETTPSGEIPQPTSAALAASPDRFGLSFGHGALPAYPSGLMYSACAGTPLDMANPDKGQCSPTQGDTSCRTALPVLCVLKDGSTAESVGLAKEPKAESGTTGANLYAAWVGGTLAATAPVAGFVLGSLAQANARCTSELGTGWRMAQVPGADGGSGLAGKRGPGLTNTNLRHWVASTDQKSNCWDPT